MSVDELAAKLDLSSHDEIVFGESRYFIGSQFDDNGIVVDSDGGMVILAVCNGGDIINKKHGFVKVVEFILNA